VTSGHDRPTYVPDTSVAMKWFVQSQEADVQQAWLLQDAYLNDQCVFVAPELLLLELANALKAGRKFSASEVVRAIDYVLELGFILEAFRRSTLHRAVEIATTYGVPVYDSYFLATAVESGGLFVTADDVFLRKLSGHPNIVSLHRVRF
jgi:predicted nucleic acid-binding protein